MFLTGPSGAGKSTLLRLLLREDLPSEGTLMVRGRDLTSCARPSAGVSPHASASSFRTSG